MQSALWCAAATSSTQHDPNVVSASTKMRTGVPSARSEASLHRLSSAAATATASPRSSSGICSATREYPPPRTHAAVASSSYADSRRALSDMTDTPRDAARREVVSGGDRADEDNFVVFTPLEKNRLSVIPHSRRVDETATRESREVPLVR
jgi:hypothetical protein